VSATAETDAVQRIVAAARACFARYGVRRTRMDDVAKEAGIVRQTVYTVISSREELIERALIAWCADLRDTMWSQLPIATSPIETLVEVLAILTETTQRDTEFADLSEALTRTRTTELLAGASPVHAIVAETFRPLLEGAREVLRTDADDDEIVEWFSMILAVTTSREPRPAEELRAFLRKFVVRAVLA
jgi:AcrR family transcriptional regulator